MPASLWKSLTMRFMTLGHSLHKAERVAAVIVNSYPVMYTIMGHRFSDAERERSPADYFAGTRSMILAGHCGIVPEGVDRDGILLPCRANPQGPRSRKGLCGVAGTSGVSLAVRQDTPVVCW